jgi:hypothetical protein
LITTGKMNKVIIVRLKGGLGNQMFQYALARRIAFETGQEVKLDVTSGFEGDFFKREYRLDYFNISLEAATPGELALHKYFMKNIPGRIYMKLIKYIDYYSGYEIKEKENFTFDPKMLKLAKSRYYDGYWQSPEYFDFIRPLLLKELRLRENSFRVTQWEEEIKKGNSVGIHIRTPHARSGELIDKNVLEKFEILTEDYYSKAAACIKNMCGDAYFYVFTEDPSKAGSILPGLKYRKIICGSDFEDLYLLSLCKHQIIANSTFSWWGAWLNTNPDKVIISPQYWYKDHSIQHGSLLNNFIRIW